MHRGQMAALALLAAGVVNAEEGAKPRPFVMSFGGHVIGTEKSSGHIVSATLPAGQYVEIETISGSCELQGGAKLKVELMAIPPGGGIAQSFYLPLENQGDEWNGDDALYRFVHNVKMYVKAREKLEFHGVRDRPHAKRCWCSVTVHGRVH